MRVLFWPERGVFRVARELAPFVPSLMNPQNEPGHMSAGPESAVAADHIGRRAFALVDAIREIARIPAGGRAIGDGVHSPPSSGNATRNA